MTAQYDPELWVLLAGWFVAIAIAFVTIDRHFAAEQYKQQAKAYKPWHDAVQERCDASWAVFFADDPHRTLYELTELAVDTALNPATSNKARALVQRGRDCGEAGLPSAKGE